MASIVTFLVPMLIFAILFNFPILIVILKKQYLTNPGIIAASSLGVLFFVVQPFFWLVLIVFFFSSTILSKVKVKEKSNVVMDFEKGSATRDAMQVIANGFIPFLFVCGYAIFEVLPNLLKSTDIIYNPSNIFFIGVFTAFAVHNSDTWATEIGILSKRNPRLVTNLAKKVAPGTSGGVTIDGLLASLLGATLIALIYLIASLLLSSSYVFSSEFIIIIVSIILGGFLGSIIDSFEGATIQGIYYCNNCNKETESHPHHPRCGNKTIHHRGFKQLNNDFVNLSSAFLVSGMVFLIVFLLN